MQDAITTVLNQYDLIGYYLDNKAMETMQSFFDTGLERIQITEIISNQSADIIKETYVQLFDEQPELLRPGGNSYTTRRYSACLRDIEYYLRYASYAIMSGSTQVLDERVLYGLRETYNSLSVPIAPTVRSIQLLEEVIIDKISTSDEATKSIISTPFQYLIKQLSEKDI
uniref:Allophycocyanin beta 18 subunit n=1 Tax=Bulboplastis apyrenoidosa TaxID=1070855 RepID=A0A1Y9TM63_9RHOD|nr:allophycocyanin beta 18 subunit [Bulboplastis apyrenoidosa]ARO90728.1 allophycocyanin beta 18 subunit [Bulboplastis apyrenoidosa]